MKKPYSHIEISIIDTVENVLLWSQTQENFVDDNLVWNEED